MKLLRFQCDVDSLERENTPSARRHGQVKGQADMEGTRRHRLCRCRLARGMWLQPFDSHSRLMVSSMFIYLEQATQGLDSMGGVPAVKRPGSACRQPPKPASCCFVGVVVWAAESYLGQQQFAVSWAIVAEARWYASNRQLLQHMDVQRRQLALPSGPVRYVLRRHGSVLDKVIAVCPGPSRRSSFWGMMRTLDSLSPSSFPWSGMCVLLALPSSVWWQR